MGSNHVSDLSRKVAYYLLLSLTHLFPEHPFSTPENIRKSYGRERRIEKGGIGNKWVKNLTHFCVPTIPFPGIFRGYKRRKMTRSITGYIK